MKEESLLIEDEIHSESADSETEPLLRPTPSTFEKFRVGRETQQSSRIIKFMLGVFQFFFCLLGLWGHRAWNNIPRVLLGIVCFYHIFFLPYCWAFPCPEYRNLTELGKRKCHSTRIEYIATYAFATASILSCVVFIGGCVAAKCKKLILLSPSQSRDIDKGDIFILFLAFLITNALLTVSLVSFNQINLSALPMSGNRFCSNIFFPVGSVTFFFLLCVSLNICHIFAACCLALGTFALDARRIIREVRNGTLDDVIRIHEDLCTVVFSTVSAYSVWFVVHWFTHGAVIILFVLKFVVDTELLFESGQFEVSALNVGYPAFLLVFCLCLFLFPCVCAARITSQCAGIYEEINCTTSDDWNEGHPFKDRRNIALFISYAKERRCGFKIGRITFDISLAWVSFFFGVIATVYPFIQRGYSSSFD